MTKTYAEMNTFEKNLYSHRKIALSKFKFFLDFEFKWLTCFIIKKNFYKLTCFRQEKNFFLI